MFNLFFALALSSLATAAPLADTDASRFKFVNIPTREAGPCDLCTGSDGAQWAQYLLANKIARIDPVTHHVKEYTIPFTGQLLGNETLPNVLGRAVLACAIRSGKDGNLYAANGLRNQLVKFDIKTEKFTVFTPPGAVSPGGNLQPFNDLWPGETGMFFSQTTANTVSLLDYKTEKIKTWNVPTPGAGPLGMRTASNDALWFTEFTGQKIARLNVTSGHITEYLLPIPSLLGPAVMRVETDSKYLWFTGAASDSIGRIDVNTGAFKAYKNTAPLSPLSVPSEDTKDGQGNVWFCTWTQNLISKLDPSTGAMTHIPVPTTDVVSPASLPFGFGIGIDYYNVNGANQLYFTQATLNRIGIYQL